MRAAQLDATSTVINYAEVDEFTEDFIDPLNSVLGSVWNGQLFSPPKLNIPSVISPRQFRQSLTYFSMRSAVEAFVTSADQDTKDWYEYATQFERTHPKIIAAANLLRITSDQLDQVWLYGSSL